MLTGNAAALYGFDLQKLAPLAQRFGPMVAEIHTPQTLTRMSGWDLEFDRVGPSRGDGGARGDGG